MSVLVLLEQRGDLKACALEAATKASALAKSAGMDLNAVFIGQSLGDQIDQLKGLGISKVYSYENDSLTHYTSDAYVPIVRDLVQEIGAKVVVGSASALGKEFCASVAARLGVETRLGPEWQGFSGKPVADMCTGDGHEGSCATRSSAAAISSMAVPTNLNTVISSAAVRRAVRVGPSIMAGDVPVSPASSR